MKNSFNLIHYQSGVIPFRFKENELQILLITSREKKKWIIPKGIVEDDLTALASAEKEAYEEAGIHGLSYTNEIGMFSYVKWGGTCKVILFLMLVQKELTEWPESNFRKRKWFSLEKSIKHIKISEIKSILEKLPVILKQQEVANFFQLF